MANIHIDQSGINNQGGTVIGVQAGRINNLHVHGLQVSFAGLDWRPAPPPDGEAIPEPGGLPPGARLALLRNATFTGREAGLRSLAQSASFPPPPPLESQGEEPQQPAPAPDADRAGVLVLAGASGAGKTQLAVEFCYRYGRCFYGLHWLDARQDPLEEIAACGEKMALQPWPATLPERAALTARLWQAEGAAGLAHLAVLDNVEDEAQLRAWLPQLRGMQVIATSQQPEWPADLGVQVLPVDALPRSDSRLLLRKLVPRLNDANDAELDPLCEQLGDLPLALFLAGSYLQDLDSLSAAEYLSEIQAGALVHESLEDWTEHTATGPAASLLASYGLLWQRLEDEPLGRRMFTAAGWCAPNAPIPFDLLSLMVQFSTASPSASAAEDAPPQPAAAAPKASHLVRARKRLYSLGLLQPAHGGAQVHTLLGEYARSLEKDRTVLAGFAAALAFASFRANESGLPAQFAALRTHVETAAHWAEANLLADSARLWNNLGYHLQDLADYAGAKTAYKRALAITDKIGKPEDRSLAKQLNNLGTVLHDLGEPAEAKPLFERALGILERDAEQNQALIAGVLNNLAGTLQDTGELDEALAVYQRALAIDEALFGLADPAVARDRNNLGSVLSAQGDLLGALDAYESALAIDEQALGPEHPVTASDIANAGSILHKLGNLDEARIYFERALLIDESVFGLEHPVVAKDLKGLAGVRHDLGDIAGAREALERALAIYVKFLPPEHPDITRARERLESTTA